MTNNKLTDETLSAWKMEAKISLGETAKDGQDYSHHEAILALVTELQERRKADSELVSHRYKLDQSGDVTSELTELRIRRWKMQALRDAHNPESTQQVKLYACAMYEACEWIQEQFRDDELSKKS
ncbi:hypothetical protein FYX41_00690 [Salmonella enterica subsp. enterica]|nr:hypothetical protein [Salmonella enterica subsp. enterica serovar Malstatt]